MVENRFVRCFKHSIISVLRSSQIYKLHDHNEDVLVIETVEIILYENGKTKGYSI